MDLGTILTSVGFGGLVLGVILVVLNFKNFDIYSRAKGEAFSKNLKNIVIGMGVFIVIGITGFLITIAG